MPDTREDTNPYEPVAAMPPGFGKLPMEEQMLIRAYKNDPEMMAVYQATKLAHFCVDCADRHKVVDRKIKSLERFRLLFTGGIAVLAAIGTWVLTKVGIK